MKLSPLLLLGVLYLVAKSRSSRNVIRVRDGERGVVVTNGVSFNVKANEKESMWVPLDVAAPASLKRGQTGTLTFNGAKFGPLTWNGRGFA